MLEYRQMIVKRLKLKYMDELSKESQGNEANTLLGTGWISTEDRMPISGKNVLVFIPMYDKIIVAYYWEGCWSDTIPKMGNPYWKVTHWMELPAPPTCA